jgi:very-short-patch-repair endonuclease
LSANDELDRIGCARHGLVRKADLINILTPGQIRHWRRSGRLQPVARDVLRLPGSPRTPQQRLLGAVWAAGRGAVASHRSAGALWDLFELWPECPEVTVPGPRYPRLASVAIHRSNDLASDWLTVHNEIPTTNPLLTMLHLGAVCPPTVVRDCIERGLVARLFSIGGLEAALDRFGKSGRSGSGVLRLVLSERALGDQRTDSVFESRMATLLVRFGLPRAVFHFVVRENGRFVAELDFAYPELFIAIEVDGWSVHGTPEAMTADFVRQNVLARLGWTLIRFTWAQVVRQPDYVAAEIGRVLRAKLAS